MPIAQAVGIPREALDERGDAAVIRRLDKQWALNVRLHFYGDRDATEWARDRPSNYWDPGIGAIELGAQRISASSDAQACLTRLAADVTLHFVDLDDREPTVACFEMLEVLYATAMAPMSTSNFSTAPIRLDDAHQAYLADSAEQ